MTTDRDHLQHLFRQSSGGAEHIDFKALAKARRNNTSEYWEVARTIKMVTADMLEEMLTRETFPFITNESITCRFIDIREDIPVVEGEISTSVLQAHKLKEFLERLESEDPDFLRLYFEAMPQWDVMNIAMPLHVTGVHETLKVWLMNTKDVHIDEVVLAVNRTQDAFAHNEFYPYDYEIAKVMRNIVSSYVTYILGDVNKEREKPSEEDVTRLLQLSAEHGLTPYALEIVNLNAPIPSGLLDVHNTGCPAFRKMLETDIATALEFSDLKKAYPTLNDDQKLALGQKFLNYLAAAYGFNPPPQLNHDPQNSSYGGQSVWDAKDKEACFAHPLGKIYLREFSEDFELFIQLLSHEFIHSMEDAALFTLNPDFQNWQKDTESHDVRVGSQETVRKLRSAALQLSFNVASNVPALKGLKSVAYKSGDYYPGEESATPPDSKEPDIYAKQLRERHAYGVQGIISRTFFDALKKVDITRDPLTAVIRGQLGMFAAEELLKDKLAPVMPEAMKADITVLIDDIKADFRHADAREATYLERLHLLTRALANTERLAVAMNKGGLINLDQDKEAEALMERVTGARELTLHGVRILTHITVQASNTPEAHTVPVPA